MFIRKTLLALLVSILAPVFATSVAAAQPSYGQLKNGLGIPSYINPKTIGKDGTKVLVELAALGNLSRVSVTRIKSAQDTAIKALGLKGAEGLTRFKYLPMLGLVADGKLLSKLQASPLVKSIAVDDIHVMSLRQSTDLIDAEKVWDKGQKGGGVAVAVLDTGVDTDHPALKGRVVGEACFSSNGRFDGNTVKTACPNRKTKQTGKGAGRDCPAAYDCSHGTHVAGIVAGSARRYPGAAPAADILAVQVFSLVEGPACGRAGKCVTAYTSDIIEGLEWVYDQRRSKKIAAVNMSLGGGRYQATCNSTAIGRTIKMMSRAGIPIVVAAGNESYTDSVASPACVAEAITIGSTDKRDKVSSFSNSSGLLDMWAPGGGISSAVPDGRYSTMSGTSMAAPHVAGVVALIKAAWPQASTADVIALLKASKKTVTDRRNNLKRVRLDAFASYQAGVAKWGGGKAPAPSPDKPDDGDKDDGNKDDDNKGGGGLLDGIGKGLGDLL